MTNNQLALDFAREVMGWVILPHKEKDFTENGYPFLVLDAVKSWCEKHQVDLTMVYSHVTGQYNVYIHEFAKEEYLYREIGFDIDPELSVALMKAVLNAERKRIGAKGGE